MSEQAFILHGDPEHERLQKAVPLLFILCFTVVFALLLIIMPLLFGGTWGQWVILGACLAVPAGLGLMKVADSTLKRVWTSGHAVSIADSKMTISDRTAESDQVFDLAETYRLTPWYFEFGPYARFGRERQIKDGWYCFAVQFTQERQKYIACTFVSAKQGESWQQQHPEFYKLDMTEIYETGITSRVMQFRQPSGRPDLPSGLISSEAGPFWLAERSRWQDGVEYTPDDFMTLFEYLQARLTQPADS